MIEDKLFDLKYVKKSNWPITVDDSKKAELRRMLLNSERYQTKNCAYYCAWFKKVLCGFSSVMAVFGLITILASSYPTIAKNQLVAHASQRYYELLSKNGIRHYQIKTTYFNTDKWQDFEDSWALKHKKVIEERWEDSNGNHKIIIKDALSKDVLNIFMEKDNVLYEKINNINVNDTDNSKLAAYIPTVNLHTSKLAKKDYKFLDHHYGVVSLVDDVYCIGEKYDWVYDEGNSIEDLENLLNDFEDRTNALDPKILFEKLKNDKNTRYLGKWSYKDKNYKVLEVTWPAESDDLPLVKEHIYIDQESYELMIREKLVQDKAGNWHKKSIREVIKFAILDKEEGETEFDPAKDNLISIAEESNNSNGLIPEGCFINEKSIPSRDAKRLLEKQNGLWQKFDKDVLLENKR